MHLFSEHQAIPEARCLILYTGQRRRCHSDGELGIVFIDKIVYSYKIE